MLAAVAEQGTCYFIAYSPGARASGKAGLSPFIPPDAVILLWKVNDSKEPEQVAFQDQDEAELNKENWTVVKTLRCRGRGAPSPRAAFS